MSYIDLNDSQIEALCISLDCPDDRTIEEFLEEMGTELTFVQVNSKWIEIRTEDMGGEMTGQLVFVSGSWKMMWDGWDF